MRIFLIMLILLIPFAYAEMEGCQFVTLSDQIPCLITSSYKPLGGCAVPVNISLSNGTLYAQQVWKETQVRCQFEWNITDTGIYTYDSSVEHGEITIKQKNNMLSIILLQIFIIAFFIVVGIPHKFGFVKLMAWGLATLELALSVWMVYLTEAGRPILMWLWINSLIVLILGSVFGIFTLLIVETKLMKPDGSEIQDDGYTKFAFKGR